MSIVNCPNCGLGISDEYKYCMYCGDIIKKKKLKAIKAIIWITILAIIVAVGLYLFLTYRLTTDEKIAVNNVKDLKSMLKDPDSLKLYEDALVLWYTDSQGDFTFYTYINYGAKNS